MTDPDFLLQTHLFPVSINFPSTQGCSTIKGGRLEPSEEFTDARCFFRVSALTIRLLTGRKKKKVEAPFSPLDMYVEEM